MFTQPATSPTTQGPGSFAVSPVTATPGPAATTTGPPSRSNIRLRGLSYLRNYTHTHLLSREHSSHTTHHSPAAPTIQPTISTPTTSPPVATNSWLGPARNDSLVAPALDSTGNPSSATRTGRLSQLVPGLSSSSLGGKNQNGAATGSFSGTRPTESVVVGTPDSTGLFLSVEDNMTRARAATTGDAAGRHEGASGSLETLPSIRFSAFFDPRATRPSLKFTPVSRTLPTGKEVIRVGRYSERDSQPNAPANAPSAAPVGFKSKVVSRRHCEFWYEDGKWYIRDVKSSSGTFLNHIRLSPPGTESKPYPINDGDIVQLGIDFKGGEEMIFRCVKMRLELNRGWQNKLNTFNMATHKRLRNMTAGNNASGSSQDCSICLNSIAPCQCLFVAPCSHTWHYKCIRSLLTSPSYPIFICPNCRAAADLEAEVEDPEEWEQLESDDGAAAPEGALLQPPPADPDNPSGTTPSTPRRSRESVRSARLLAAQSQPAEVPDVNMLDPSAAPQLDMPPQIDGTGTLADPMTTLFSHTTSPPVPIPSPAQRILPDGRREARTPSPTSAPVTNGHEGPITPRNDAGPWVFDGSGVRLSQEGARPAAAALANGGGGPPSSSTSRLARVDDVS